MISLTPVGQGNKARTLGPTNNQGAPIPYGQKSPFAGFNDAGFQQLQRQTEAENRRVSLDEYTGLGGQANDYYKLYGGVDNTAFGKAQAETQAAGTRIGQQDWLRMGGNPNDYYKLYGDPAPEQTAIGQISQLGNQQQQQNYTNAGYDAALNRVQEYNPYGKSEYITNPDGSVSRVSSLSQPNQQVLDAQFSQEAQRNDIIGQKLGQVGQDLSQANIDAFYQKLGQPSLDVQGERMRAEQSMKDNSYRSLDRQFGQEMEAQKNFLLNRGVAPNSEQWNRAMQDFTDRKTQAYQTADAQAIQSGRDEFTLLSNAETARRNQALQEFATQRGMSLQDAANLLGMNKGAVNPSFSQNYNVNIPTVDQFTPTVNYMGQQSSQSFQGALQDDQQTYDSQQKDKDFQLYKDKVMWDKVNNKPTGGGGGGGGGRAPANPYASFENSLISTLLGSINNPQQQQVNPLLSGLVGGLSTGLGAAVGNSFGRS
jgi:hypothetical protein